MDYRDDKLTILTGDCLLRLADLHEKSVQTVVTSPPYFGLRQYLFEGAVILRNNLTDDERLMVERRLFDAGIKPRS